MKSNNFIKKIKQIFNFKKSHAQNAMELEIKEQPEILGKLVKKYFHSEKINLGFDLPCDISQIRIIASGSSKNVGDCAVYFIEKWAQIPCFCSFASEFANKEILLQPNELVVAISQSGETADTYKALKKTIKKGAITLALTNNENSKIHTLANYGMKVNAGKENSVAATKSFTAQLLNLYAIGLYLAEKKQTAQGAEKILKKELKDLKLNLEKLLNNKGTLNKSVELLKKSKDIVITGRGANSAIANEGALKIKETSYINTNGYPSGEFLHGHMAFIDKDIPLVSIIPKCSNNTKNYKLALKNTSKVSRKRKPPLIILKTVDDFEIQLKDELKKALFIEIPDSTEEISVFYTTLIMQLLALSTAKSLNRDIDKPRSLEKAVISE